MSTGTGLPAPTKRRLFRRVEAWFWDESVNPREYDPYKRGYSLRTGKPLPLKRWPRP